LIEALAKAISSGDYIVLGLLVILGLIAAPVATVWMLWQGVVFLVHRRNGGKNGSGVLSERVAIVEADVASLKDEFRATVDRLTEHVGRENEATRREVRDLVAIVSGQSMSLTGEFRLLREALAKRPEK